MQTRLKQLLTALLMAGATCLPAQDYPYALLAGDYPDPTVMRDGEDFYMTHSPFVHAPGFLIWHSRDLHQWEPIVRVCPDYEGSAMAPDLIKHDGRYYLYYPTATGEVYVIHTDDLRGEWSQPVRLNVKGIDPGHVVGEDGRRYLYINDGRMVQLSDDGLSVTSEVKKVYDGWVFPTEWETEGMWLESPKLIYKNGYYYMTSAEGGTAGPPTSHMCAMARSRSVQGPWEDSPYNPLVHTYSASEPWWSKGHGTLIDDADGNWWMIYHAYPNGQYTLGRHTLIEPMRYTADGWFVPDTARALPAGIVSHTATGSATNDDFSGTKPGLQWMGWRENPMRHLSTGNGTLQLHAKGNTPADARLLLTTAGHRTYETSVGIQVGRNSQGGMLLYYNEQAYAGVMADRKNIYVYTGAGQPQVYPNTLGSHFTVRLSNRADRLTVEMSNDHTTWHALAKGIDVSHMHHNRYKGFFALRIALASAGRGKVNFTQFRYQPATPTAKPADKPLYRDPIYDGAADPVLIYNKEREAWWMFYTNRRANMEGARGVDWVHGSPIGIAESTDGGITWHYVQDANIDYGRDEGYTYWAPDIVEDGGRYHMFLTIVPGVFSDWRHPRMIVHLESTNLIDWAFVNRCEPLVSNRVIDASLFKSPEGEWIMYYNNEADGKTIWAAKTTDFIHWTDMGQIIRDKRGEGAKVFRWHDRYYMIIDNWDGQGVYCSTDLIHWKRQQKQLLAEPGKGPDDGVVGNHADVVVCGERAYIVYFTHPERNTPKWKDHYGTRRSSIQVAELIYRDGEIFCDRDKPVYLNLNAAF